MVEFKIYSVSLDIRYNTIPFLLESENLIINIKRDPKKTPYYGFALTPIEARIYDKYPVVLNNRFEGGHYIVYGGRKENNYDLRKENNYFVYFINQIL